MAEIKNFELEKIKRYFAKHVTPKLKEDIRREQEFRDMIEEHGIAHYRDGLILIKRYKDKKEE